MKLQTTIIFSLYTGIIATVVALIAFTLSWNMWEIWGEPLPGYQVFLYPGNLMLIYVWHPLFTEEINFWPKLGLLLVGQFSVVTFIVALTTHVARKIKKVTNR